MKHASKKINLTHREPVYSGYCDFILMFKFRGILGDLRKIPENFRRALSLGNLCTIRVLLKNSSS